MPSLKKSSECIDALRKVAAKEGEKLADLKIDDEDAIRIIDELRKRATELQAEKGLNEVEAFKAAANEATARQSLAKTIELRNKIDTDEKVNGLVETVMGWVGKIGDKDGGTVQDGLKSVMEGFTRKVKSAFRGLAQNISQAESIHYGGFVAKLQRDKLWNEFRKDTHSDDIIKELTEAGSTDNKVAKDIAAVWTNSNKAVVSDLNEHGAWISSKELYITMQDHNHTRIRDLGRESGGHLTATKFNDEVSFTKWREKILPLLNTNKTFPGKGDAEIDRILKGTHGRIVQEYNGRTNDKGFSENNGPVAISDVSSPGSSIAKSVSEKRHFHFKDPASWMIYNKEFGSTPTLSAAMESQLRNNAKKIGMMKMFGADPEKAVQDLLTKLQDRVKDRPDASEQVKAFDTKRIDNAWYDSWLRATGFGSQKGLERTKFAAEALTTLSRGAKLGGTGITSGVMDRQTMWVGMMTRGLTSMEAFSRSVMKFGEKDKDMLQMEGFALGSSMGQVVERMGGQRAKTAKLKKWEQKFFTLNGLNWITDDNKATAANMLTWVTGRNKNRSFAEMEADDFTKFVANDLRGAGIEGAEWDVMRKAETRANSRGDELLLPSQIKALPDEAFHSLIESRGGKVNDRSVRRAREELTDSYGIYIADQTDKLVLTPGLPEQRQAAGGFLGKGLQEGTLMGVGMKMIMQFRSFPLAYMNKFANRALHAAPASANHGVARSKAFLQNNATDHKLFWVANIATAMVGAYMVMDIKSILRGQGHIQLDQDDPKKQADLWKRVALTSGTLGLLGDSLFEDYDKGFQAASTRLMAGPIFGDLGNGLFDAFDSFRDMDPGKGTEKLLKTLRSQTPGGNFPIVGDAVNFLIFDAIQEMMSPGSVDDRNKRRQQSRPNRVGQILP